VIARLALGLFQLSPVPRSVWRQFQRVRSALVAAPGLDDADPPFKFTDPPRQPVDERVRTGQFRRKLLDGVLGEPGPFFEPDHSVAIVWGGVHGTQRLPWCGAVRSTLASGTVPAMNGIRVMIRARRRLAGAVLLGVIPTAAASDTTAFSLHLAGAMAYGSLPDQDTDSQTAADLGASAGAANAEGQAPREVPLFGKKGTDWWSISASGMADDDDNRDFSLRLGYHCFIADNFEISAALTGWYHDQPNDNEFSGSFDLGFRYHFLCDEQNKDWTVYADIGIGWQHYSNASITGSDDNPARDSFQVRAGVMFPFPF